MRVSLAIVTALALGGCSLFTTQSHPRSVRGQPACASYAAPVIDSVMGVAGLALEGLLVYMTHDDGELDDGIGHAKLYIGLATAPYVIGAAVGYVRVSQCHRELTASTIVTSSPAH